MDADTRAGAGAGDSEEPSPLRETSSHSDPFREGPFRNGEANACPYFVDVMTIDETRIMVRLDNH